MPISTSNNSRIFPGNVFFAYASRPEISRDDLRIGGRTEPISWLDGKDLEIEKKAATSSSAPATPRHPEKTLGVFYAISIHERHLVALPLIKVPYTSDSFARSCTVAERTPATFLPIYPAENGVKLNMQHLHLDRKYDPLEIADFPGIKAPSVKSLDSSRSSPPKSKTANSAGAAANNLLDCDPYIDLATPIFVRETDVDWGRDIYYAKNGQKDVLRVLKLYRFVNSLDDPLTKDDEEYYAAEETISVPRPKQLLGPGAYLHKAAVDGARGAVGDQPIVVLDDDKDVRTSVDGKNQDSSRGGSRARWNKKRRSPPRGGSSGMSGAADSVSGAGLVATGPTGASTAAGTVTAGAVPQQAVKKDWAAIAAGETADNAAGGSQQNSTTPHTASTSPALVPPEHNQAALEQRWGEIYNRRIDHNSGGGVGKRGGRGRGHNERCGGQRGRGGGGGQYYRGGGPHHIPLAEFTSVKPPPVDAPNHASDSSVDREMRKQLLGEPWPEEWEKKSDAGRDGDGIVLGLKGISVREHGWDIPQSNMPSHIHVQNWLGLEGEDRKFKGWSYEDNKRW